MQLLTRMLEVKDLLNILCWVGGSLILGLIVDRVLVSRLNNYARRIKWNWPEILVDPIHKTIIYWFLIVGLHWAIEGLPLTNRVTNISQKSLIVIIIFSVTIVTSNICAGFISHYINKDEVVIPSSSLFVNLTKLFIYILGLLAVLYFLGISVTHLVTALGIGGLAVALALQDTLSNLFAGMHIIASRQVKPGDFIMLETGQKGKVTDVNWRITTIEELPNNKITIPNKKMSESIITNYSKPNREIGFKVQVGVSYDSDLEKVEKATLDVAKETMKTSVGGVTEFEPVIRFHTFGASSIDFNVILRAKEVTDKFIVQNDFIKRLHERYKQENITIPYPIRTIKEEK